MPLRSSLQPEKERLVPPEKMVKRQFHMSHEDLADIALEVLKKEKRFSFRATGTSMSPLIKSDDTVVITPDKKVNIGDVVLVKTDGRRLLLHRVTRKQKKGVVTMGDAALTDDGFIPYENILGKAIEVSGNGYNLHLKNPFKYFIGRLPMFIRHLRNYPFVVRLGKRIALIFC